MSHGEKVEITFAKFATRLENDLSKEELKNVEEIARRETNGLVHRELQLLVLQCTLHFHPR
jgi:hypothetical protein